MVDDGEVEKLAQGKAGRPTIEYCVPPLTWETAEGVAVEVVNCTMQIKLEKQNFTVKAVLFTQKRIAAGNRSCRRC